MAGQQTFASGGSTVIIRSKVVNAFNRLGAEAGSETKAALGKVSEAIEKSGNKSAGLIFEQLVNDLGKDQRDGSALREYWQTITQLVPDVAKMVDAVAKITALF